jgi:hypothetical protein
MYAGLTEGRRRQAERDNRAARVVVTPAEAWEPQSIRR